MSIGHPPAPMDRRRVCAVVVTYHPDLAVTLDLLRQLDDSDCDFIVIDNHSSNIAELKACVDPMTRCQGLLALGENIGQAAALNRALDEVARRGYELALLFDQDSSIGAHFVGNLLTAWDEAQALTPGRVAAVGPRLVEPHSGRRMPFRSFQRLLERRESQATADGKLIHTAFLITSGSLVSTQALAHIGPMRSDYFIDNVDLEWCFRAVSKGYALYGSEHASLLHRIGEDSDNPLVKRGLIVQHSALRYYYSTRNRLHLHRQPYAPAVWRVKDSVRWALKTIYLLITSAERRAFWSSLRRAVRDVRDLP